MLRMSSVTVHVAYSCQTMCKTRDSFIDWTCSCPMSSPLRLLTQKLLWASDEGFKIASLVALHIRYTVSPCFSNSESY